MGFEKRLSLPKFMHMLLRHIVCLCETWFHSDLKNENVLPNCSYKIVLLADRSGGKHGDVTIIVNGDLSPLAYDFSLEEFDFACLFILNQNF